MALIPIFLSSRGLSGEKDPTRIRTGDLLVAENVDFGPTGLLQKDGGASKLNTAAVSGTPRIIAGMDYWPGATSQRRLIACADGTLYKDDQAPAVTPAFATQLKTGLATDRRVQILDGGQEGVGSASKAFFFNGADPVQVLSGDGATTAALATPPTDWTGANHPRFGFLFRGNLLAGGNDNRPHVLYASLVTNQEDFTAVGTYQLYVYPGESQRLVAGVTALGRGWVWKYPTGVYWINDAASAVTGWYVQPASREYGAIDSPHCVQQVDDTTVAFLSHTGRLILMQESSGTLSGVTFVDLTKALALQQLMRDTTNLSRLPWSQLRWYADKKQLHVTYAGAGATIQNRRMVIDFNGERTRAEMSAKETCESLWMEDDADRIPRPVAGDNVGYVRFLDQAARTVDGSPYRLRIQTSPTDFSDLDGGFAVLKNFYRLHLEYEATGNYDVTATIYIDGVSKGAVTFSMGGGSGAVLPFTLPAVLGGTELRRRSRDICGQGYYFSLDLQEATTNNPKLGRAWVECEPLVMQR